MKARVLSGGADDHGKVQIRSEDSGEPRTMTRWLVTGPGRVRLLVGVLVALVIVGALTYALFVWPTTEPAGRVDAVVVFAGGNGERQEEGIRLVEAGVAPVLVISHGGLPGSSKYRVCREPTGLRVICLGPHPPTTRGEARAFTELANREGWHSLALVTSTPHVRRASLLLGRCFSGSLSTVATPLRNDRNYETALQVLHEWGGLLRAVTVDRSC
jgi:uncharacterized SAM-binding protein YcdF (DUF218 family)